MVADMDIVHRVWAGPPMPAEYAAFGETWAALNPSYQVWHWTEEAILDAKWHNQAVVDHLYKRDGGRRSVELFAQLADVVDYELLYRWGGVYVNCDIEPVRGLESVPAEWPWVASEDKRFVVNAAMAGPAGHPFYADLVDSLAKSYWDNPAGPMNRTTGPWFLTQVLRRHPEVTALPVDVFNPVHWRDIPKGEGAKVDTLPDITVGVHHWGHRRDGRTNTI